MKIRKTLLSLLLVVYSFVGNCQQTFHDFTVISIVGDTIPLSQFYGKKVLVVNTASFCGYTYQFGLLQALDSTYSANNFVVVGFPCNDFGGQDPYADSTIATFCTSHYGVTFPMMQKVSITATDTADVYKWLQRQDLNGVANAPVSWNFNKFCIDETGHWVRHFQSTTAPFDTAITNWILSPSTVTAVHQNTANTSIDVKMNNAQQLIQFSSTLNNSINVNIDLVNIQGQVISKIYSGLSNGYFAFNYSTSSLNQGIYIVRAQIGNQTKTEKIVVLK